MNEEFKEISWLLMLIPFGIVSAVGIFFLYCAWRRACQIRDQESDGGLRGMSSSSVTFQSLVFELPSRWLAVKARDPRAVEAALNLHHSTPCSCEEGLIEARDDKLFISPPISGWVLVVGPGLPGPFEDVDDCYRFLTSLSRKLGQVQFFSASRVVPQHAWAILESGRVYRAYAWSGQTLWNQGTVTAAEKELDMRCYDYGTEQNLFMAKDDLAANSERIGQLASRWRSLDPTALANGSRGGLGIVGALSHSRQR